MNANNNNPEKITAKEELGVLRTEILESEKARIQLLQYKLIAVATLAAIGLGFTEYKDGCQKMAADYVLCIIPFVCLYVDLLCHHNSIRILVIARFLHHNDDPYEGYILDLGNDDEKSGAKYLFKMEDFALFWSSMGLSILLALYSFIPFMEKSWIKGGIFFITGIVTALINFFTKRSFAERQKALFTKADELKRLFNAS